MTAARTASTEKTLRGGRQSRLREKFIIRLFTFLLRRSILPEEKFFSDISGEHGKRCVWVQTVRPGTICALLRVAAKKEGTFMQELNRQMMTAAGAAGAGGDHPLRHGASGGQRRERRTPRDAWRGAAAGDQASPRRPPAPTSRRRGAGRRSRRPDRGGVRDALCPRMAAARPRFCLPQL